MRDVGPARYDQVQLLPTVITKVSLFKKELRDVGPARYDQVQLLSTLTAKISLFKFNKKKRKRKKSATLAFITCEFTGPNFSCVLPMTMLVI